MLAAGSGDTATLTALLDGGAKANARETERGHTALMFAAAANRLPAVKLLLARGADPALDDEGQSTCRPSAATARIPTAGISPLVRRRLAARPAAPAAPRPRVAGLDRQYFYNELVHAQGGMTPLHFAVRQGYADAAMALLDAGVDVNQLKVGDNASPLLIATVNGHFDLGRQAARARRRIRTSPARTA